MEVIKLRDEYIKLGQALKAAGLVETGVDAKVRQCRRKKWKLLRCVKITSNWARH